MRSFTIAALVLALAGACRKTQDQPTPVPAPAPAPAPAPVPAPAPAPAAQGYIPRMTQLKDQMCACKDAACATAVQQQIKAYGDSTTDAMSPDEAKTALAIGDEITACAAKARGSAAAP
jgi:hypothetical protein